MSDFLKQVVGKSSASAIKAHLTDSLNMAISNKQIALLDVGLIDVSPYQPRLVFNQEQIEELAKNIRQNGQKNPIIVRSVGSRYELIGGERRLKAIRDVLNQDKIEALIVSMTDEETAITALIDNTERSQISGFEEALFFQKYCQDFNVSFDANFLHQKFAIPIARCYRVLSYFKLPKAIIDDLTHNPNAMSPTTASLFNSQINDAKLVENDDLVDRIAYDVWSEYLEQYKESQNPSKKFIDQFVLKIQQLANGDYGSVIPDDTSSTDNEADASSDSQDVNEIEENPLDSSNEPPEKPKKVVLKFDNGIKRGSIQVAPFKDDLSTVSIRVSIRDMSEEKLKKLTEFLSSDLDFSNNSDSE